MLLIMVIQKVDKKKMITKINRTHMIKYLKIITSLVLVWLCLFSCTKEEEEINKRNYFIDFFPRKCEYTKFTVGKLAVMKLPPNNVDHYYMKDGIGEEGPFYNRKRFDNLEDSRIELHYDSLLLNICTSSFDYNSLGYVGYIGSQSRLEDLTHYFMPNVDESLDEHDLVLEKKLKKEIRAEYKPHHKTKTRKITSALEYTNRKVYGYRTSGIKDVKITCLDNKLLFDGKEKVLRDILDVYFITNNIIVTYDTKEIIYGKNSKPHRFSLNEWLDLKPMAQTSFVLKFTKKPSNLPLDVRFKIDMETTEGLIVSDTTSVIRLLP